MHICCFNSPWDPRNVWQSPINWLPSLSRFSLSLYLLNISPFSDTLTLFSGFPFPPFSFKTRVSFVPQLLRKPPSSWMQPLLPGAPADRMLMRTSDGTPTCCSHCTFTSTAWRRLEKGEVSIIALLLPCSIGPESCPFKFIVENYRVNHAQAARLVNEVHTCSKKY